MESFLLGDLPEDEGTPLPLLTPVGLPRHVGQMYLGYGTPLMDDPHFPSAPPVRLNRVYFSHCEKPWGF